MFTPPSAPDECHPGERARELSDQSETPCLCDMWNKGKNSEHQNVVVSVGSRNGAPPRKGCVVNGQMTTANNQ